MFIPIHSVAAVHVDGAHCSDEIFFTNLIFALTVAIVSLGDLSFELVRPILESCSAENLRRLEDATPVSCSCSLVISCLIDAVTQHLRAHTNGTPHSLCVRNHDAQNFQTYGDSSASESTQPRQRSTLPSS